MANERPLSLNELMELLPRLQSTIHAVQQLTGGQNGSARQGAKDGGLRPTRRASPRSREAAAKLRDRIPSFLSGRQNGASIKELSGQLSASPEAVRYALKLLRGTKQVRMSGHRATARWHAR